MTGWGAEASRTTGRSQDAGAEHGVLLYLELVASLLELQLASTTFVIELLSVHGLG
jgi:hypothetical protein